MLNFIVIYAWSIAYLLAIIFGMKYHSEKKIIIPLLSGSMNFAWEINAVIVSRGYYGHLLWCGLDFLIFLINISTIENRQKIVRYIMFTIALTIGLYFIFRLEYGMLVSVFIINMIMSVDFILQIKHISVRVRLPIAVLKMLGTLAATLDNMRELLIVCALGFACFALDLFYVSYCLEESSKMRKTERRR